MAPTHIEVAQLNESIRLLAQTIESNDRRMQRMESRNRRLIAALLGIAGVALWLWYAAVTASLAEAGPQDVVQRMESGMASVAHEELAKVKAWEQEEKERFHRLTEGARADMNKSGKLDPLKGMVVILKDIKDMLEAVPRMADNMDTMNAAMLQMNQKMGAMPAMAVDMHEMNGKMGIMSYGVDSTMGRMGRMMPWMP